MKNNNYSEKENFRTLIEDDNLGDTEERLDVIDAFLSTEEHVTLEELMSHLRERGHDYEPDFVRQCMNRWVDLGFAQKELFDGQPPRYEHRHLGNHHDHLICTKCGRIVEFSNDEIEGLQAKIAALQGFHILQHKMEIYGLCSDCIKTRRPLMPLTLAKPGERIVIRDILGGREARARLASMGLRPGDHLEVISNDGLGRLIIAHASTRLALGRGMAQKIMASLDAEDQTAEA
ncbi:MAG: transcriptional repressor [Proteobacteria bacterium]|nr:transcriptional repressor [Pseudomonadota bacterium]